MAWQRIIKHMHIPPHWAGAGEQTSAVVRETMSEVRLRVANHTSYHRCWVADMFYQVPKNRPTTDLPVYLRSHAP